MQPIPDAALVPAGTLALSTTTLGMQDRPVLPLPAELGEAADPWPPMPEGAALVLAAVGALLVAPRGLVRFCPNGFRRRLVVRGADSLVSLLAFEAGQREHIHRHLDSGEYFHGVLGSGYVLVDDTWHPVEPGLTHFRPPGAWHGVSATSRLVLLSIQAPVPCRTQTVWRDPPEQVSLRPEDRAALAQHRCCRCPCCGGHVRRQRPCAACGTCGSPRAAARCENCGWSVRRLCLPGEVPRAS